MPKRKSKASVVKKLKQSSKEAMKVGLTPGQIAGIVGGSVAVAGLGTAAGILAANDRALYRDYLMLRYHNPTFYDKYIARYPERYVNQVKEFARGDPDLIKTRKETFTTKYNVRSFGKKVSKKPSASLRRLCKKHKVRLTVKRGKKRVYKSEKVLKKQCKKAKRRKK